jgi:D-alanyl-lipoteichoic acid acyltransferase DltB (MBOAT superfamily)
LRRNVSAAYSRAPVREPDKTILEGDGVRMLFPTGTFVAFFAVVFALSWALARRPRVWKPFISAAGFFFYAFWGWRYAILLAGYTLVTWLLGRWLVWASRRRGWILAVALIVDLAPLAFFKYYGFIAFNLSELFHWFGLGGTTSLMQVAVPVGISFTTFRGVSYLVDIYRRKTATASLIDFAIFMSFFPYLAAGPIARVSELLPQLKTTGSAREIDVTRALYLIALGLAKKVIIGDFLARSLVDGVFSAPGQYSSLDVVVGIHAYAVQIYCDFSGYSDMAIGIALLLGFVLPVNFDRPYTARSVREFWRRWHMTLSGWIRDYLYIPMGGSRKGRWATYRNIAVTMVLCGLWHGAGWTFLVWGLMHGAALVVEHVLADRRKTYGRAPWVPGRVRSLLSRVLTLEFVVLAWIFFRADSLTAAGRVIGATFTAWDRVPAASGMVIAAVAVGVGLQYLPASLTDRLQGFLSRRWPVWQGVVFGVVLFAVVLVFGAEGVSDFIYIGF